MAVVVVEEGEVGGEGEDHAVGSFTVSSNSSIGLGFRV